jgi:hypothetical protein
MTEGESAVHMNDRHNFPVSGLVELSERLYWALSDTLRTYGRK